MHRKPIDDTGPDALDEQGDFDESMHFEVSREEALVRPRRHEVLIATALAACGRGSLGTVWYARSRGLECGRGREGCCAGALLRATGAVQRGSRNDEEGSNTTAKLRQPGLLHTYIQINGLGQSGGSTACCRPVPIVRLFDLNKQPDNTNTPQ